MTNFFHKLQFIILLLCCAGPMSAQLIEHSSTFKEMRQKHYFRAHYDNDFFTNTDHYYSQGIQLEYAHPVFKKNIINKLLVNAADSSARHGVNFNLSGYTPTSINSDAILFGDRPFEANMYVDFFAISLTKNKKVHVTSAISLGVMGPAALGEEIQTNIHRWTGNKIPKGWQHQIRNDLILNYRLQLENKWITSGGFLLNGVADIRAGTLHNRVGTGINFMTGHFNDPYKSMQKNKTSYYLFGKGQVNFVGHDATMQGGIFNRKSPYTISANEISRITFQATAGVALNFRKVHFSYSQSFLTREFKDGRTHRWGGVSAGFIF